MSAWIFIIIKYSTIVKANFIPQSQISVMETSVFQALRLEKQLRDQESISFFTHAGTGSNPERHTIGFELPTGHPFHAKTDLQFLDPVFTVPPL